MKCPFCGEELVDRGRQERYETLLEHVSDPNAEAAPPRPVMECLNRDCPTATERLDAFWDEDGDFYCARGVRFVAGHKASGGRTEAVGSFAEESWRRIEGLD